MLIFGSSTETLASERCPAPTRTQLLALLMGAPAPGLVRGGCSRRELRKRVALAMRMQTVLLERLQQQVEVRDPANPCTRSSQRHYCIRL